MTETGEPTITSDELDWAGAEVQEGRQPGMVVSVRLGPDEASRLRLLAESEGLTVSQVVRRALAAYETEKDQRLERTQFVAAFTYGGAVPVSLEHVLYVRALPQTQLPESGSARLGHEPRTTTEPTRITERVLVGG